jgi:hypothetical protein
MYHPNKVYHTMNILAHIHQTWDYAYQLFNVVKVIPTLEFLIHSFTIDLLHQLHCTLILFKYNLHGFGDICRCKHTWKFDEMAGPT